MYSSCGDYKYIKKKNYNNDNSDNNVCLMSSICPLRTCNTNTDLSDFVSTTRFSCSRSINPLSLINKCFRLFSESSFFSQIALGYVSLATKFSHKVPLLGLFIHTAMSPALAAALSLFLPPPVVCWSP